MEETVTKAMQMPAVALRGLCILPGMIIHFDLSRVKSKRAVEQAILGDQRIFIITQRDDTIEEPALADLYGMGTIARLKQMSKLPNGIVRVLVEGMGRARLLALDEQEEEYLSAEVEPVTEDAEGTDPDLREAMLRELKELFHEYSIINPKIGRLLDNKLSTMNQLIIAMDTIVSSIPVSTTARQEVLSAEGIRERYEVLSAILNSEIRIGVIKKELTEKIQKKVNKNQKDYILREQMNAIREELGDGSFSDGDQFEAELKKLKADKEVKEKVAKEISRFKSLAANSSESAVERAYIETLLELPWNKVSKDNTDIERAEHILEEDHYGMNQVKERILEFLAVRSLTGDKKEKGDGLECPIICLVGLPGTGKTSIAKSVARALDKEYVRISLGGIRDEAEIRGHRKTYVGAMPGRIVQGLKQAGVKNPLLLLDEIDKAGSDHRGDTSAALLEVLDSEQNCHFRDHYVEIPIDLSQVLFIATANSVAEIPRPLLDRMELIEVSSYTENEKYHIAKEHLVLKALHKNGLDDGSLKLSDGALKAIITDYTRESGVRELERKIGEICRKAARELLTKTGNQKKPVKVTAQNLEKYLGKVKYTRIMANDTDEVGIVRGLAWTSVGGDTLQIEVNMMPGKGEIELTGQMGDVMKESALTGLSYVRSISKNFDIAPDVFKENDFHIHIPEGAVPKDGPSAGITMATALVSAITGLPVHADLAMTGEITLRGRVLPIGGLKEKILAAKMAGMKRVLVPKKNEKDVEEISSEIKNGVEICFVERMEEVLKYALIQ